MKVGYPCLSIANIYYIGSKLVGSEKSLESIRILIQYLNIRDGNKASILHALAFRFTDFEDALQNACALKIDNIEAIITRNTKDYTGSSIPFYTPSEFTKLNFSNS